MALIEESDLSGKSRTLWLKSIATLEQRNYDHAISLLEMLVKEEPEFLTGRKALRRACIQKKKGEKKARFSLGGGLSTISSKGMLKKDLNEALVELEKALIEDPYNIKANTVMFEVASKMENWELAEFALETIKEGHPDNTKSLHLLAQHYLDRDDPQRAADVYAEIMKRDSSDLVATKGNKDATARASMRKGNWESEGGFRDMLKNEKEAQELEGESRAGMTKEQMQAQLAKALADYTGDQNNLALVRRVAGFHERLEQFDHAAEFYTWAHHLSEGDVALERKAAQMAERASEKRMIVLQDEIESLEGDERAVKEAELAEIKAERSVQLIGEAEVRVDRNPTDPQLRYELGNHLVNAGRESDAIPHLQRARNNPHIRTRAILLLGRCYEKKGMLDMAQNQLNEALGELVGMDGTKKEVLYTLGLVSEKKGDHEKYLECMKEIYEADYGYRDVAHRVESSYA